MLPTLQVYDQTERAFKHPHPFPSNSLKLPNTQNPLCSSPHPPPQSPSGPHHLTHSLQQNPECSSYIFPGFDLKTKLPKPTATTKTTAIVLHASNLLNNRSLSPGDRRFYSKHLLDFLFYRDFLAQFFHFSKKKSS